MTNEKTQALQKMLVDAPRMSHNDALAKVGYENIASIYDLARVRRYLTESGEDMTDKAGYIWTGDFIGIAPNGHPAEGEMILAKVEGYDMNKTSRATDLGSCIIGDTILRGSLIPSDKNFARLGKNQKFSRYHGTLDFGQIVDFEEVNGIMVPVTNGIGCINEKSPERDFPHFGPLVIHSELRNPINLRAAGFYAAARPVFENSVHFENRYAVLKKQDIAQVL